MSNKPLQSLFEHARMGYSEQSGPLDTLRHILLLQIKSSPNDFIEINGVQYTEDEILRIIAQAGNQRKVATHISTKKTTPAFKTVTASVPNAPQESGTTPSEFNENDFWLQFPELRVIAKPNGIVGYFKGDMTAFLSSPLLSDARTFFSQTYASTLEQEIYACFDRHEFFPAAQRLTHIFVFNEITQNRIRQQLKDKIDALLQAPETGFRFLTWEPYYKMLTLVATDDTAFLEKQYQIGKKQLSSLTYEQGSTFFSRQIGLPFDPTFKTRIQTEETKHFNDHKNGGEGYTYDRHQNNYRNSAQITGKTVLLILGMLFALLRLIVKCDNRPDYTRNEDPQYREIMNQFEEQHRRNRGKRLQPEEYWYPPNERDSGTPPTPPKPPKHL